MANICTFDMKVVGTKDNIDKFIKALCQEEDYYMGRGASIDKNDINEIEYENGEIGIMYYGCECKWSINSSLILNAIDMREHPEKWSFGNTDISNVKFITIQEASKIFDVDVEIFSKEEGMQFQEHILIKRGKEICIDHCDWVEIFKWDYDTKEDAETENDVEITDKQWEDVDDYINIGGYNWEFTI